jgi:small subunit ribosomal protein S16
VAVKIRLKRMGKIRSPYYRIVVADSRTKRDGRVIEEIGKYHPKDEPSLIEVQSERAQYWLGVGAQPTEAVAALLKVTGDWQRFRGDADAEGTLKVKEPAKSKQDIFNEILKESGGELEAPAATPRKRPAKKTAEPAADQAQADEPKAAEAQAAEPKADEGKADEAKAEPAAEAAEQVETSSAAAPAEEPQPPADGSNENIDDSTGA